jgi:UDP-2-acetamido-3-amino-2,3-dideoxy-glucuronate N-acetyltransferase
MRKGGADEEARVIHPTAEVHPDTEIGADTRIWHYCHIREGARIGGECVLGRNVYIEDGAIVGNRVKIQNNVSVYRGVELGDGVFVGPSAVFTNDLHPRAINPDGSLKSLDDWTCSSTRVRQGAAIGAGAVIVCGTAIGRFALVGAGAVVTRDVPDHGLVLGNPARLVGYVCACSRRLQPATDAAGRPTLRCAHCRLDYDPERPAVETARPAAE